MLIEIEPYSNKHRYRNTCVAQVLLMLSRYYRGYPMTIDTAVKLTRCEKDGAWFGRITRALGMNRRWINTLGKVRQAIRRSHPVIAAEETLHGGWHAILIVGFTRCGFHFIDPAIGKRRWKSSEWMRVNVCDFQFLVEPETKTCKT